MISAIATTFAHEKSLDLGSQHTCTLHVGTYLHASSTSIITCAWGLLHDVVMRTPSGLVSSIVIKLHVIYLLLADIIASTTVKIINLHARMYQGSR